MKTRNRTASAYISVSLEQLNGVFRPETKILVSRDYSFLFNIETKEGQDSEPDPESEKLDFQVTKFS